MTEVARQGVELVQAHLKMAQSFQKADMVGRDDVLRAETALAQISAQYDQGRHGVELARAALNVMMGIPPDEETVPAGDFPDEPRSSPLPRKMRSRGLWRPGPSSRNCRPR